MNSKSVTARVGDTKGMGGMKWRGKEMGEEGGGEEERKRI